MMSKQSLLHTATLLAAYDFSDARMIVDVGGGDGTTLAAILQAHPAAHGTVLDLPRVIAGATTPADPAVAQRWSVVGGDMEKAVPPGADCYLIKRVLCDLSDDDAVALLARCATAATGGARIVVVDQEPTRRDQAGVNVYLDVLFLATFGAGRVRSAEAFASLAPRAGLVVRSVCSAPPNLVVEMAPRSP